MGYVFNCDGCGERKDHAPPFMGEFRETFLKTSPSALTQMFRPGQTVTLCKGCSEVVFLSGTAAVCQRCGFFEHATDLPDGLEECPQCGETDSLTFRGVDTDD